METSNQTEQPKKEVNILLLAMSTLSKNPTENSYYYKDEPNAEKGKYIGQLEPIVKYLTDDLEKEMHELYILNTEETKEPISDDTWEKLKKIDYNAKTKPSAFEYFKERCGVDKNNIKDIDVDNVENAVYEISNKIQEHVLQDEKVHIYIDIHGGLRDTFTVVDAVMMLIKKMNNVDIAGIYTVEYKDNRCIIKNCTRQFDIFDFVSGINEFLSFGRSEGLIEYNKNVVKKDNKKDKDNDNLVKLINSISDGILLNRTNNFEENLKNLSEQLNNEGQKSFYDSIKNLIKDNYKVILQGNEYNLLDSKYVNYFPAQLQWCIDKKHYQQALVLIENRTAGVLCDQDILITNEEEYTKMSKESDVFVEWVNYSLFTYVDKRGNTYKYVFKKYECHFNNIHILNDNGGYIGDEKLIKDIRNQFENINNLPKTYNQRISDENSKNTKKQNLKIPVNKDLIGNEFLNDLYILMFTYYGLKKYRNTVAHPNKDIKNDLSINEVEKWMQFYINFMAKFISKYGNKKNEKVC